MDKFLIKLPKPKDGQPSSSSNQPFVSSQVAPEVQRHINSFPFSNTDNMLDFKSLEADPKDQMPISSYGPNIRDTNELESRGNVRDSFTRAGFRCWNKALERFKKHVGKVLLLTNELNKVLQKKDQDIANAMGLLDLSKKRLQMMREDEWDSMMDEVSLFCGKHGISIPKMNEGYSNRKSKRKMFNISYLHHFRVEVFYAVIDLALQELNNRFDVVTSDLLLGMASLSSVDSFANFHKDRIMKLSEYYSSEFGDKELRELNFQLDDFIVYAQKCDSKFLNLKGIKDLARVMIETKLDQTWLLVKLTLIILVATASVERAFSSMKYIKNDLRNRMDEYLLNGCLVFYIERSIFKNVSNYAIIDRFQNMKTRRGQL
ncbi:uncharacterized protein LOC125846522 [Solanum stenotomum]|uniref:uncharacterized protein LOC125846522 n=1 Tax=Solanum stenotomum TaxID=172797 RepID=UPI0020D0D3CF|nr:uncharacterized protein LOC125846522 [Solanum stenotomum]